MKIKINFFYLNQLITTTANFITGNVFALGSCLCCLTINPVSKRVFVLRMRNAKASYNIILRIHAQQFIGVCQRTWVQAQYIHYTVSMFSFQLWERSFNYLWGNIASSTSWFKLYKTFYSSEITWINAFEMLTYNVGFIWTVTYVYCVHK